MVKKIRPVSRVSKIEAEINRIAGEVFSKKRELVGLDESWVPYVDVSEKGSDLIVEVELPGVAMEDITIMLYQNRIEIKGIKKEHLSRRPIAPRLLPA